MQQQVTEKKNQEYFSKHLEEYRANVARLDTYQRQRAVVTGLIEGSVSLVDIGNGGVFDYDTAVAQRIIESTVPRWFYVVESLVYRPAAWLIDKLISHPATLQYPVKDLERLLPDQLQLDHVEIIPKGRWILQFGVPFPSWLTPAQPVA